MTQAQVAKKASITQAALSQMEKADIELRTATLEKLADAMGLSAEQLTNLIIDRIKFKPPPHASGRRRGL